MIVLTPFGGICNRLLALHSAIRLSMDFSQPLRVIWRVDNDLGCRFQQLFEVPPEVRYLHNVTRRPRSASNKIAELLLRSAHWPPTTTRIDRPGTDALAPGNSGFDLLRNSRHVRIEACQPFYQQAAPFYRFTPTQRLMSRIGETTKDFRNTVGIHIRANVGSAKFSPTALFRAEIEKTLEQDPTTTFFLATDDPRQEEVIRSAFPGKILCTTKRSLDRSNHEAIEDAIVDLYALAATDWIIGSAVSTFSICAGRLGKKSVKRMLLDEDRDSPLYRKVENNARMNA